ncbi:hypothetical protein HJFPF1_00050 [Paramyrothecium foliicola]|nr:hypothetical protein HJFPF1_00050 [Paramyrothecium foliicola]
MSRLEPSIHLMDSLKAPQEAEKSLSEQERKKLRNRLSQRAFRRRQAECIRDLKSQVEAGQKPDGDRVEALQRENRQLRKQLVDVQTKLSKLLASMQLLSNSVSETLDNTSDSKDEAWKEATTGSPHHEQEHSQQPASEMSTLNLEPFDLPLINFSSSGPQRHAQPSAKAGGFATSELLNSTGTNPIYPQIPNIWSFEYQMGMQPYISATNATEESSLILGRDWTFSNSPFSDHILLLQRLLKNKLDVPASPEGSLSLQSSVYQPVLMVLSMFNSITRPDVMAWYAKTRFYHIIELTAWQLFPSPATFEKLHPRYRPTETQLNHIHPRVIDWIPFPTIRDRLIQLHAANPQIDQIFCDAVTGYVVEALMSDLIRGAPPMNIYVRVTDLITAMSSKSPKEDENTPVTLPAPDVTALFSSPAYARAAFSKLNMDKGASYYKIDPAFYEKYPELYDQSSDLTATGIPLKPKFQKILTYPKPLDLRTVETYRSFIDFSLDAGRAIFTSEPR